MKNGPFGVIISLIVIFFPRNHDDPLTCVPNFCPKQRAQGIVSASKMYRFLHIINQKSCVSIDDLGPAAPQQSNEVPG